MLSLVYTHTHTRTHARAAVIGVVLHTFVKKGSDRIVKPRSELCRISKQVTQGSAHRGRFPVVRRLVFTSTYCPAF